MKKEDLRKVKFRNQMGASINGYFHQWGSAPRPQDNGIDIQVTCGIIEQESDGVIKSVPPEYIGFVDSF